MSHSFSFNYHSESFLRTSSQLPDHLAILKMQLFSILAVLLPAVSIAQARQFPISTVDTVVDRVRQDYSEYFHHLPSPGSSNVTTKKNYNFNTAAADQSYWYEQIAHQGISAFGAGGYQVYRNVKDFGAKGENLYLVARA